MSTAHCSAVNEVTHVQGRPKAPPATPNASLKSSGRQNKEVGSGG